MITDLSTSMMLLDKKQETRSAEQGAAGSNGAGPSPTDKSLKSTGSSRVSKHSAKDSKHTSPQRGATSVQ